MFVRSPRPTRRPARLRTLALAVTALAGAGASLAPAAQAATAAPATSSVSAGAGASADVSASSARSVGVAFSNSTNQQLIRTYSSLSHGCWDDDNLPPDYVAKHTSPSWGSHSCGMLTGTEGYTNYRIAGTADEVRMHWNNPYSGRNGYWCDAPSGYQCSISGGSGNNATVRITLTGGPATLKASAVAAATPVRSTAVNLLNDSGRALVRTGASLSHGVWSDNSLPASLINPGASGSWKSESSGFMTGTEGRASYMMSEGGIVSISWNNPFSGGNSYTCNVPTGFACDQSGGGGKNAQVTFRIRTA
ncbi:Crystal protein ET79 [Streptomyces sp. NPDC005878]|uniref:Crystal protein ET79 n=1 Tax=Streptomyces sp. NPDC005878 TaxID=3157077 RepID=UPI0033DE850E